VRRTSSWHDLAQGTRGVDLSSGAPRTPSVTLEITLAPPDLRHAKYVLPHQLTTWAAQVGEVLCVLDLRPVPGRPDRSWQVDGERLVELVDACSTPYSHAQRRIVDYGDDTSRELSAAFLHGRQMPAKTYRGGPFYAYFFGLNAASHDHILHLDSDIMFGGGSQTWIEEATHLLESDPDVLACLPFPGPPRPDGRVHAAGAVQNPGPIPAFAFKTFTTRYFMIDRSRFRDRIGGIGIRDHSPVLTRVGLIEWLRAVGELPLRDRLRPLTLATPRIDLPERLLGEAMAEAGMHRVDYLGREPGMWTLHPRERTETYYRVLPELVARIERDDVTEEQRGHYDLHESMLQRDSSTRL
jgi:hypothetical protein